MLKRYLFEYEVISTSVRSEFSIVEEDEKTAKQNILDHVADFEFTDESDIKIGKLIKTMDLKDTYYECVGCT